MGDPNVLLVAYCHHKSLDALLGEVGERLSLSYRTVTAPEEIPGLLNSRRLSILIIGQEQLDDACVSMTRVASTYPGVFVICVADVQSHGSTSSVLRAGAVACMSTEDALASLAYVVESIYSRVKDIPCSIRDDLAKEIEIGYGLRLLIPDYKLTDGLDEEQLLPISGRLLECLAANLGQLVPFSRLMSKGWKTNREVSRGALHQQMYVLKDVLEIYGASHWIQCSRGKGYLLAPTAERGYSRGARRESILKSGNQSR